jgi:hypothetical protein
MIPGIWGAKTSRGTPNADLGSCLVFILARRKRAHTTGNPGVTRLADWPAPGAVAQMGEVQKAGFVCF